MGNNIKVSSYVVGGVTYDRFLAPDTLVLNRALSTDRLVNIWLTLNSTLVDNTPPTDDIANLDADEVEDADAIYLSGNLNAGYDNILVNIDDAAAGSIEVETERVDVIWYSGIQTSDPTTAVFPVIERGGNDNIAIAAITSLNSDGTPASYSTLIGISENDWPGSGSSFNNYLILRRETAGSTPLPLLNIGTDVAQPAQVIQGVAVSFTELGISANQSIFGYSIFPADVVNGYVSNGGNSVTTGTVSVAAGIDLTDISTFPNDTRSNDSGLDLVAGVSAAVASDDNLIETVGPGGYKSNNVLRTWLKANDGAFVSNGGAASTEGGSVGFWEDQSVADNNFTTLTTAPTFRSSTSAINFNPTVDFLNGTETGLLTPNSDDYNQNGPYTKKSINIAFRTSSDISTRQQLFEEGGGTNGLGIHIDGGILYGSVWNRGNSGSTGAPWNTVTPTSFVSTSSISTDTEYILTLEFDGNTSSTGTITLYLNGQSFGSLSSVGLLYNHTGAIGLGDVNGASRYHNNTTAAGSYRGEIAEFIYCNDPAALTTAGRNRIESYLAIKYGITLDQSSPINYVNSAGDIIFNTTSSAAIGGYLEYNNDIAGIGRDDDSELDQPASRSENVGSVVTIDRGASISTDDTWLIWGNDGAALTETTSLTKPDTIDSRLNRVWRVAEENEVLTTSVSFDITGLSLSTNEDDFSLLIASNSSNADFSNATVLTGGTLVGNTLTFDGVDLEDGQYFTLGTKYFECGPGGIVENLSLWLKANDGPDVTTDGTNINTWSDKSGDGNDATAASGNEPNYSENSINFNPTVNFDESNTEEITGSAGFHSVAYYMVVNPDNSLTDATDEDVLIGFTSPAGATDVFGALALGSTTGAFTGEVITHAIGGTGTRWRRGISSSTISQVNAGETYLFGIRDNADAATSTDMFVNGLEQADLSSGTFLTSVNVDYEIGSYTSTNAFATANHYDGQVGEVISYSVRPDDTEHLQIQTYLAIKYGITLDQTSATNYLAADGGTIWNATDNSGYANDIAGIGRDDNSCLEQKQSKSVNTGSIVAMGLGEIAASNNANSNSFATDDSFLVWGNDGASATEASSVAYTEGVVTERMLTVWRADENAGTVGATDISFDLTGLGYTGSLSDYNLIISDASGLTSPTIVPASSFAGDVVTFSDIDLTDGQFFTLGTARTTCSPGGVDTDLYVWLRADAGTSTLLDNTTLATWTDQAGNENAIADGTPPLFKNNTTDNINFNPTIDFDGTDDRLTFGNLPNIKSGAANGGDYTLIALGLRQDDQTNYILGSPGGTTNEDLHFGYRSNTQVTLAHWGNDINLNVNAFDNPTAPYLVSGEYDGTSRILEEIRAGTLTRTSGANTTDLSGSKDVFIGERSGTLNYNGAISEIIIFDNDITDLQKQQVYTYLAIKYGITLSNDADGDAITNEVISGSVREGDYVASDGATIIWTYADNTAYSNDIAGIGRDDDGCFVQKQSTAQDTDDILTVGLGNVATSNGDNANGFDDDKDYFVWGNDNGSTDRNNGGLETSDVPSTIAERMTRVWKAQDTGNVGETELQFDLTGTNFSTADASSYSLLISDVDGDMTNAMIVTGGTFNGSVLSFDGIDIADGQFFTIGTAFVTCGPGGVNSNIALWLRGDLEAFSDAGSTAATDGDNVLQWNDQSSPADNGSE
ncbi:beta strand repeat-containing protein, partial [Roseivirga sp.]|uniref:beta strand repeat-containing protein n=1 Tax=Roseivirga sp. TaxID=1964215 RepID=UPI003B8D4576